MGCLTLREDESDELYSMTGETGGIRVGQAVVVEGTVTDVSVCMQGTTLLVTRVGP